jgi:hypothetical protein
MRCGREPALEEGDDGPRSIHGLAHLGLFGIRRLSRIPVAPSVLRQRRRASEVGLQRGIYGDALSAKLHQVMRLPEGSIVPGKKGLQHLLHRLLAMKGRIAQQGRRTGSAGIEQSPLALHRGRQGRSEVQALGEGGAGPDEDVAGR